VSGRVLVMAGGTGGHVFPALAVAEALRARQLEVVWMGTRLGLEARVVPAAGITVEWITIGGLRGKSLATRVAAPFKVGLAVLQALRIMMRVRPAVVLGMGGYAAGPGGVAAWLTRRPLVIHEQNAVAGTTNRLLAHLARRVLAAFPGAFPDSIPVTVVGNPVRASIAALPSPDTRLAGREGRARLLVLGGSQGALALNEAVPEALAHLPEPSRPVVRHQAATRDARVRRAPLYQRASACRPRCSSSSMTWPRRTADRRSRDLQSRGADGVGAGCRGAAAPCWCRFRRRSTTTRRSMRRLPGAGRRLRCWCPRSRVWRTDERLAQRADAELLRRGRARPAGRWPRRARGCRACPRRWPPSSACCSRSADTHFAGGEAGGALMNEPHASHQPHPLRRHRRLRHGRHRRGVAEPGLRGAGLRPESPTRWCAASSRLGARVMRSATAPRMSMGVDVVVVSSAVAADNPEVVEAREAPHAHRGQARRDAGRADALPLQGVAVAGTHGKTTTTSLVASVLAEAVASTRPSLSAAG
jgi:hypothetical protein